MNTSRIIKEIVFSNTLKKARAATRTHTSFLRSQIYYNKK